MRRTAGYVAGALAAIVLALLALLHVLSPEFTPSWRVVSEYANGHYGWVLTLMFVCWALSSWTLTYAVWPYVTGRAGKAGLIVLIVAGFGQALAAAFDINQPLHGLSDLLGGLGFPIGAMLVSFALVPNHTSLPARKTLLLLANLTWLAFVATIAGVALLFVSFIHAGGHVPSDGKPLPIGTILPAGVIAIVGYANRLYVVVSCLWAIVAAKVVLDRESEFSRGAQQPIKSESSSLTQI